MPYTQYDYTKPTSSQTGPLTIASAKDNMNAIRDAMVMGAMVGFNKTQSGGTAEQPAIILLTKGTEIVKAALTWGTTGGEAGNVTVAVYSYSANSGTLYDTIGTKTLTYDANGNLISTTWS